MKYVCSVCGYVHEGETAPEKCPMCGVGAEKFVLQTGKREWACEHVVGVAQGVSQDIIDDLRANFNGECSEVGMYLAMARVAHREGYPEIGMYYEKAAYEEAERIKKEATSITVTSQQGEAAPAEQQAAQPAEQQQQEQPQTEEKSGKKK